MTFEESIPIAKQLAEKSLARGFDVDAFIILCEINKLKADEEANADLVLESNIDECINNLLKLFVTYYNNKSVITLKPLIDMLNMILSELYHTCNSANERIEFKNFINNVSKIAT